MNKTETHTSSPYVPNHSCFIIIFPPYTVSYLARNFPEILEIKVQGGSNMTGTDLYVNKPHCAAAVRP